MSRVAVAIAVFALSLASFAQRIGSSDLAFTVAVRNSQNAPVPDARVELRETNGQIFASGYTNSLGTVEFRHVPASGFEVLAISGTNDARERVDGAATSAGITLRFNAPTGSDVGGNHSVSVAQYKVPGKARDQFEKARKRMMEGKMDEAMKYADKAIDIYPKYSEALTLRCVLELDKHQLEQAVSDCEKSVENDSGYAVGYFALGAAYNQTSRYDDAIRMLDRGTTLSPMDWQGYFELSKAQIGKGNYQAALRSVEKAKLYIKGEYAPLYLVKGHILLALKNYGEAMADLQAYLEKAPKDDARSAEVRATLDKVKAFTANGN